MAVVPAPSGQTHELPGGARSPRWPPRAAAPPTPRLEGRDRPRDAGGAAPADPGGGVRRPRGFGAVSLDAWSRTPGPATPSSFRPDTPFDLANAGDQPLRPCAACRSAARRAPRRGAVHAAVGPVSAPPVPLARLFAIAYRLLVDGLHERWSSAGGPTSGRRSGSCCWRCGRAARPLTELPAVLGTTKQAVSKLVDAMVVRRLRRAGCAPGRRPRQAPAPLPRGARAPGHGRGHLRRAGGRVGADGSATGNWPTSGPTSRAVLRAAHQGSAPRGADGGLTVSSHPAEPRASSHAATSPGRCCSPLSEPR